MSLVEFGFSISDIEKLQTDYDVRLLPLICDEAKRQNEVKRLLGVLDVAEAVNRAYIGAHKDKHGRNQQAVKSWQNGIIRRIKKLKRIKEPTVWEKLTKSKRL